MESDPEAANILFQITILVILTLINAFFAGSEMAVVSVNKNKIHRLSEQGNKNAALIERLMKDSTVFLSTIQVAITLAGFFSSASAATGIAQVLAVRMAQWNLPYSQTLAGVVVTIILAYFNLVFGELVPKRIALQKAEAFSLFCVRPIYHISRIMNPFIKLLSLSTSGFLKLIGMHNENLETDVSEEEIKSMLETGSEAGVFNDIEKEMITSIFSFDDKRAKEVMVPRQDMVALDINEPLEEFLDEILESMHSKIPVYEGEIDNIIGVLSTKALTIEARRTSFDKLDVRTLLKPAYFVPENRRTDALFREMDYVAEKMKGRPLDTVYFGGGTPTSLNPGDLDALLCKAEAAFPTDKVREFTVEGGRPDSITQEKLEVLRKHGITRISINPQTMNQKTLDLIGRRHTVEQVEEAFRLAREEGFTNINMDLILGLPGETKEHVERTMEAVTRLCPDSLTVHSLAIKRASRLSLWIEENGIETLHNTDETMEIAAEGAARMNMKPYYLYRQKNMSGNFENVGYATEGNYGIYNILIMEEKQTIMALGAGTISKAVYPDGRIERCDNVKDVALYIEKIDEMIDRKRKLLGG